MVPQEENNIKGPLDSFEGDRDRLRKFNIAVIKGGNLGTLETKNIRCHLLQVRLYFSINK